MSTRDRELQLQKAKRRLQAITFLTNISLDGSYKDTGWGLEHAKHEAAVDHCKDEDKHDDPRSDGNGGAFGCRVRTEESNMTASVRKAVVEHHINGHSRTSSADAAYSSGEVLAGGMGSLDISSGPFGRKRYEEEQEANTTQISDARTIFGRRVSNKDSENAPPPGHIPLQKHAHFSSNESMEQVFTKSCKISNTNLSETSLTKEPRIFNMRENPPPVIKNQRLVIVVNKRSPVVVFSTIPYSKSTRQVPRTLDRAEGLKRTRNASGSRPMSALSDPDPLEHLVQYGEEEVSYGYLLKPSNVHFNNTKNITLKKESNRQKLGELNVKHHQIHADTMTDLYFKHPYVARCISYESTFKPSAQQQQTIVNSENSENKEPVHAPTTNRTIISTSPNSNQTQTYHSKLLDDPELRAGKHRTLLTFPSYMTSVIDYCKPSDLKKELNDKFRDRFPQIQLTLSKLRSLKREMRKVAKSECNIDLLTVAQAYVYFEKLILLSFVSKSNRKYSAGACLLLSAKLNDIKGENLHNLIEKIETVFRVNKKDLLSYEFAVLVALEFALHLPTSEVSPHYQRLLYES